MMPFGVEVAYSASRRRNCVRFGASADWIGATRHRRHDQSAQVVELLRGARIGHRAKRGIVLVAKGISVAPIHRCAW